MRKRFNTEQEIISDIDRYQGQIEIANKAICGQEAMIKTMVKTVYAYRVAGIRVNICELERQVAWRQGRLNTLKQLLSEFRTAPIVEVLGNDASIPS